MANKSLMLRRRAPWIVLLGILLATLPARPASKAVDLDGNGTTESSVVLQVLQTWPPKIQNKVINNSGAERVFNWLNAGPGGFSSRVAGELRWTWETGVTIYSYTGTVCRNDMCTFNRDGSTLAGAFKVPGRTVTQGAITTSTASLTSSLIQSFSPGVVLVECTSSVEQLANGNFGYTITCTNPTGEPVTVEIPPGPPGCCEGEDQLSCSVEETLESGDVAVTQVCVDYLEDPNNCGACGNVCDEGEVCSGGFCQTDCAEDEVLCDDGEEYCADLYNDSGNCGACGYACYEGEVCVGGYCELDCADGETVCAGEGDYCADLSSDPYNCGACFNYCDVDEICVDGSCVLDCADGETVCEVAFDLVKGSPYQYCADLSSDRDNCGSCGHYCNENEVCVEGSCELSCADGETICCNYPALTDDGSAAAKGDPACYEYCADTSSDVYNCGGCDVDCYSACGGSGLCIEGACNCRDVALTESQPAPTRHAGLRQQRPVKAAAELVPELPPPAPICETSGRQIVIPARGSFSECYASPYLAREVLGTYRGCGGSIPDGSPLCDGTLGSQGPFQQFEPDPSASPGAAFINVVGVQMNDASGNGLIEPGEKVCFKVDVVNSGSVDLTNVQGTLVSPPIDLTCGEIAGDDCVPEGGDPASVTILNGMSAWPDLPGVPQTDPGHATCDVGPAGQIPKTSLSQFCVRFPTTHPADVTRPFGLQFTADPDVTKGFVTMQTVPFALGVADRCVLVEDDFPDTLRGMYSPMNAKLVPVEQPANFSATLFKRRYNVNMTLATFCGGAAVGPTNVAFAPRIVKLVGKVNGEIDPTKTDLSYRPLPFNPFFTYVGSGKWTFSMRTNNLKPDTYVVTIRIDDVKDYHVGFVLK